MKLNWRGDQVLANVLAAAHAGVQETTDAAEREAEGRAPSSAARYLQSRPARIVGPVVLGQWGLFGSKAAEHALRVERGDAAWPGDPYLRPAQDAEYSKLTGRIRRRLG